MDYSIEIKNIFKKNIIYNSEEIQTTLKKLEERAGNAPDRTLSRMKAALNLLNLVPIKVVNIVGTNGKGTVSKAIFDSLSSLNISAGLYTSPHLVSYNERIRTNDGLIEDEILYPLINLVNSLEIELIDNFGPLTYFEVLTLVANIYFSFKGVQIAVLEAGVGGLTDATRPIGNSFLSIITSISIDHISALGNTIESIARHKAGIIKKGSVITLNKGTTLDVIREESLKLSKIQLYDYNSFCLDEDIPSRGGFKTSFLQHSIIINPKQFGIIRGENFSLAFAGVVKILEELNLDVDKNLETIADSLSNSQWEGRMQAVSNEPLILLDGAHNLDAIEKLFTSINYIDYKRLITIIAIMDRKNHQDMTKLMRAKSDVLIVTSNGDGNSTDIELLSSESNSDFDFENVAEAINFAKKIANPDDLVLVAGSLYLVGEVLKLI